MNRHILLRTTNIALMDKYLCEDLINAKHSQTYAIITQIILQIPVSLTSYNFFSDSTVLDSDVLASASSIERDRPCSP